MEAVAFLPFPSHCVHCKIIARTRIEGASKLTYILTTDNSFEKNGAFQYHHLAFKLEAIRMYKFLRNNLNKYKKSTNVQTGKNLSLDFIQRKLKVCNTLFGFCVMEKTLL